MNLDPDFELSADMRLLELQRAALGLAPPNRTAWQSRALADNAGIAPSEEPVPQQRSAVLAVELTATPSGGVIPGAVVTLALSVANDGAAPARGTIVAVPVPGGAAFRPGSFVMDGRDGGDDAAEHFFGSGLPIGELAAGTRRTFVWKLGVRLGTKPLLLAPVVRAEGAGVVGARALAVSRKETPSALFAAEIERADPALYTPKPLIPVAIPADELPIYELDAEEEIVFEAADAALSSAAPPPAPKPAPPPPPAPEPAPAAIVEPEPVVEREPIVAPVPIPEPPREAVVLYGRFDRATLAFFERTFNGSKPPTILSHCIFASALACATPAAGDDAIGLKAHLAAQSQILHRAQLHERLGKKEPIAEYAGELLAALERIAPAPVVDAVPAADALALVAEIEEPTRAVLAKIAEDRARWDFVKARQLTLALQAQRVAGRPRDDAAAAALENALRVYAQTSMTVLQKLFVRLRIDRTTGVLFQNEAQLDAAARALVAALGNAFA
ncbi:MAG: hypothetical protein KGN02_12400 [bacterium]|nr:hypothetical protein [bacterium]